GDWAKLTDGFVDQSGQLSVTDADVAPGRSFEYALSLSDNGAQLMAGQVWVDIPKGNTFALTHVGPNPSSTGFHVSFSLPSSAPATLELVNVSGKLVQSLNVGGKASGTQEVDLGKAQKLAPGVYWVHLTQAGRTFSQRVVAVR